MVTTRITRAADAADTVLTNVARAIVVATVLRATARAAVAYDRRRAGR